MNFYPNFSKIIFLLVYESTCQAAVRGRGFVLSCSVRNLRSWGKEEELKKRFIPMCLHNRP